MIMSELGVIRRAGLGLSKGGAKAVLQLGIGGSGGGERDIVLLLQLLPVFDGNENTGYFSLVVRQILYVHDLLGKNGEIDGNQRV